MHAAGAGHRLGPFEVLVGEWEVSAPAFPGASGRATFAWIEDGAYLLLRSTAPAPAPDSTWIIGGDDAAAQATALYYDSRGVARVYQMRVEGDTWRVWRDAPGFAQRYEGTISADGRSIRGAWEMSEDGDRWRHDFELNYYKDSGATDR